jgi:hypothetical protein
MVLPRWIVALGQPTSRALCSTLRPTIGLCCALHMMASSGRWMVSFGRPTCRVCTFICWQISLWIVLHCLPAYSACVLVGTLTSCLMVFYDQPVHRLCTVDTSSTCLLRCYLASRFAGTVALKFTCAGDQFC